MSAMDELLARYADTLDLVVEAGTYVPRYTAIGILGEFARKAIDLQTIESED